MHPPADKWVKVGKINTRYWAEGEGPPVVLVHGFGGCVENWLPCFGALAERYRVYAVDLVGLGRTDKPLDVSYSIMFFTQFLRDFMATLGIERAHVAGHSMGGAIGLRLTLMFPGVVDKLALVNSAGLGRGATFVFLFSSVPLLGELLTRPSRASTARFLRMTVYDPGVVTEEICEHQYRMASLPGNQQCLLKILRANGSIFGQSRHFFGPHVRGLASITRPVLVVTGRHDRIMPASHSVAAAKCLPNARLKIFEDCGHVPMFEATQAFNKVLLDFLSNEAAPILCEARR